MSGGPITLKCNGVFMMNDEVMKNTDEKHSKEK